MRLINYYKQYIELKDSLNNNESIQKLTSYSLELDFATKEHQLTQQQREKDLLYLQKAKQQRLINAIFLTIIVGMVAISVVYYRQKRTQQKINLMLAERNHEVLHQKTDLNDQAQKLNDLNTLKDRLISILAHDSESAAKYAAWFIQPFTGRGDFAFADVGNDSGSTKKT